MSAPATDDARVPEATAEAEAPLVLDTAPPRPLGFRDQAAFWANLGVSLLGFSGAAAVLAPAGHPALPFAAAVLATIGGTLVGTAMVAVAGVPGARSGAPAMALLRGLFGTRISYVPTAFNIVQCIGWGTFELTVIAGAMSSLTHGSSPRWLWVVIAGVLTTAMSLRPLGMLRVLRRYVTVAVGVSMLYFTVQLLRHGLPTSTGHSWSGFFPAVDATIAVAVSWVPLAADYTRHARSSSSAFWGAMSGYSVTQIWCYLLGLLALAQSSGAADGSPDAMYGTFTGVSAGWAFFAVLVVREVDQSFANVYSTAMSVHNLAPRLDRRVLCLVIGAMVTAFALAVDDFSKYENFLYIVGALFVPLFGVLVVDLFWGRGRVGWDLGDQAPSRWVMVLPWMLGFATYQLINPGTVGWWARGWGRFQDLLHVHPQTWTSASLYSFVVAAVATALAVLPTRHRGSGPAATRDGATRAQ